MRSTDDDTEANPAAAPRPADQGAGPTGRACGSPIEGGLEALTMRKLGQELGSRPMALYRHVANKDDLVDGIVDLVFGEIDLP